MKFALGLAAIAMVSLAFAATSQDSLSMADAENVWGAGVDCGGATAGVNGCTGLHCTPRLGVKSASGSGLKVVTTYCRYINSDGNQVNCGSIKVAAGCITPVPKDVAGIVFE